MKITEVFGSNVFSLSVMRQRLPEDAFEEVRQVLDNGGRISLKTADVVAKYVHKGSKLYIEGKIKTRSYDDNQGRKCYVTEIHVDVLELLDPKPSNNNQPSNGDQLTF